MVSEIRRLKRTDKKADFNCGNDVLDLYLQTQAGQDEKRHAAISYALVKNSRIAGYYTLSSFIIELTDVPKDLSKKLPRYSACPATLIGRLAVDAQEQGTGVGEYLLLDALKRAYDASKKVASAAVVVDAIDESAANFYRKYGFVDLTPGSERQLRLFIPMHKIKALNL